MSFTHVGLSSCCRIALLLVSAVLLGACTALASSPEAAPPVTEDAGWTTLAPGLEARLYRPNGAESPARLLALRVDPARYTFRVHYRPGEPLRAAGWRDALPGVVAFVNANFFNAQQRIEGLLVADGTVYGNAYQDRGGTFVVENGLPRVRSTRLEPYLGEPLEQAVQAFPMLVQGGEQAYFNTRAERSARRTAIGQDDAGRIVLMATTFGGTTLPGLSAFLPAADMRLVNAFNLDGGGSTMMYFKRPGADDFLLPSIDPVPAVLAVYKR